MNHHLLIDRIRSTTTPLIDAFSLAQFTYFSIDQKGNSTALCTDTGWMEYYLSEKLFIHNPFLRSPKKSPEGVFYRKAGEEAEKYGVANSLVIATKTNEQLIGFSFGFKHNYQDISSIPLLKNYAEFFLNENKKILLDIEPISLLPFFSFESPLPLQQPNREKLLKTLGLIFPCLTPKETEVLEYLSQGETAKSTAEKMKISKRTVESHIDNCKNKMGCFTKSELIQKGKMIVDPYKIRIPF